MATQIDFLIYEAKNSKNTRGSVSILFYRLHRDRSILLDLLVRVSPSMRFLKEKKAVVDLSLEDDDFVAPPPRRRQSSLSQRDALVDSDAALARQLQQEEQVAADMGEMEVETISYYQNLLVLDEESNDFVEVKQKQQRKPAVKREKKEKAGASSSSSSAKKKTLKDSLLNGEDDLDQQEEAEEGVPHYALGIAPSNAAKCLRCEECILKGHPRAIVMYVDGEVHASGGGRCHPSIRGDISKFESSKLNRLYLYVCSYV